MALRGGSARGEVDTRITSEVGGVRVIGKFYENKYKYFIASANIVIQTDIVKRLLSWSKGKYGKKGKRVKKNKEGKKKQRQERREIGR